MPTSRTRAILAIVTALAVALSACLVLLVPASASAAVRPVGAAAGGARSATSGAAVVRADDPPGGKRSKHHHATKKAPKKSPKKAPKKAPKKSPKKATKAAKHRARARLRARWAKVRAKDPSTWIKTSRSTATPSSGPHFNNPYGPESQRRALLDEVVAAIRASPGYRVRNPFTHRRLSCPTQPRYWPSRIRIAVYSIADMAFAEALVGAQKRCVSVQVLMNSHLTAVTSPSWRTIVDSLGKQGKHWRGRRSFAHRCSNGCLGTAVLHSKVFLFSHAGRARDTVMVGSSNMARNATRIQFNDLYTINDAPTIYGHYLAHFQAMAPDRTEKRSTKPQTYRDGDFTTTFYPYFHATARTDRTMQALRGIRCGGARGESGIGGHTVLYIAMHSWYGVRGRYLAARVREMYRRGCYVRILYSFMGRDIYDQLTVGTGRRMTARRVLFPGPLGLIATKYSHMKMFAASGNIGGDRSHWTVWTGSNNFTDKGPHADEVTLRIDRRSTYDAYVRQWKFMRHRRSSPYWAVYEEPTGGGRAP